MVTHVCGTLPYRSRETGRYYAPALRKIFELFDVKNWIVALEMGKGGYRHYQVRFDISGDYNTFFEWCKQNIPPFHIEEASVPTDLCDYERKDGFFVCSQDTPEILKVRFGRMLPHQRDMLAIVDSQNDREVDVWLDPRGNHGKTWLSMHLWERGEALVVPRYAVTPEKLSGFVCSSYKGQKYIIIDIPRAGKPSAGLYEELESLKDGLVSDTRYHGRTRNVRGAKVIVFTNKALDKKQLSHDRWRLHGIAEDGE